MNPRITVIVVVVFLLLLAFVVYGLPQLPAPNQTPPRPAPRVFTLPVGEVKSVEVRDLRKARELKITRVDNKWQVEKPEGKPANTTKIDPIVEGFAGLQARRVFTDVTDLTQYGVLTPMLEARMVMRDSTPYALSVGNKAPDGSYYAIYPGDTGKLFIIANYLVDEFVSWFDNPPYEPTPTPSVTPTTPAETPPAATIPAFVPTLLPVTTPTP